MADLVQGAAGPGDGRRFSVMLGPAGLLPLALLVGLGVTQGFDGAAFGVLAPEIRHTFHLDNAGKQTEVPARELIHELIDWFLRDVIDDLGIRNEVKYANRILDEGSSADRQIKVFNQTGDTKDVVAHLIKETKEGLGD